MTIYDRKEETETKCLRIVYADKEKSSYEIFVTASFSLWTSLGLNQGPPDYESD